MIVRDLYIDRYDWHLRVFYAVDCYYTRDIIDELKAIQCPRKNLERAYRNMASCRLNTGLTYSNNALRETIMVIGTWSSPAEFDNSFSHELRHFTDHVAKAFELETGGEDVAYLSGEIRRELFPVNKMFLCACCNHDKDIEREICRCKTLKKHAP